MNLRNIDLYLLSAFDLLLQEKSVSRAADKMFMTQPAMSYALNRLRCLLDDPLLIRTPQGMQPTKRALDLIVPVKRALAEIERIFHRTPAFDPTTSCVRLVIGATDYATDLLVVPLIRGLARLNADVHLRLHALNMRLEQALGDSELALILDHREPGDITTGACSELLLEDSVACLTCSNARSTAEQLTLEDYLKMQHIAVSADYHDLDPVDRHLDRIDCKREIVHSTISYRNAADIMAGQNLVLTCPARMVPLLNPDNSLKCLQAPPQLPNYRLTMHWTLLNDNDAAVTWLRDQLRLVIKQDLHTAQPYRPRTCEIAKEQSVFS